VAGACARVCGGGGGVQMGAYEAAIGDFTRVLELDATNANAYFNR